MPKHASGNSHAKRAIEHSQNKGIMVIANNLRSPQPVAFAFGMVFSFALMCLIRFFNDGAAYLTVPDGTMKEKVFMNASAIEATRIQAPDNNTNTAPDALSPTDPDGLRICRVTPHPIRDAPLVSPTVGMNSALPFLHYQCAGPNYDEFADTMWTRVRAKIKWANMTLNNLGNNNKEGLPPNVTNMLKKFSNWGARPHPLPIQPNDKPQSILFVGHSHTRQLFTQLTCQYQDQLISSRSLMDFDTESSNGGKNVATEYKFQNNITMYGAFNQPFFYSKRWKDVLEMAILHKPIDQFDALVIGPLHSYAGTAATAFRRDTLAYQARHPEQDIDFVHILGPTLKDFADIFAGPIIYAAPFNKRWENQVPQNRRIITAWRLNKGRTNMRLVNGRAAINDPDLLNGTECGFNGNIVGTCNYTRTSPQYSNTHKCIGAKGGEPDLVAWDVIEALYGLLS